MVRDPAPLPATWTPARLIGAWLLAYTLWLAPSVGQIDKYLHPAATLAAALVAAPLVGLGVLWGHRGWRLPLPRFLADRPLMVVTALVLLAFAIIYPLVLAGIVGGGSDRGDALDAPLRYATSGRPPYLARTFQGEAPTPLPGALLLAAPFHLIGAGSLQTLLWLPLLAGAAARLIGRSLPAAGFVAVFVLACPGTLQDVVTGGDYLVNAIYVAIALLGVWRAAPGGVWLRLAAWTFLAIAVDSRPIYAVALPIAAAVALQRGGWRRAAELTGVVTLVLTVINVPIWLTDPPDFPFLLHATRLAAFPPVLRPAIPAAGVLVAAGALFVRLTPPRIMLLLSASLVPILAPPLAAALIRHRMSLSVLINLDYLMPITLYAGLWLFWALAKPVGEAPPRA